MSHKAAEAVEYRQSNGASSLEGAETASTQFSSLPAFKWIQYLRKLGASTRTRDPYFRPHEGNAGSTTLINGKKVVNFGSYDYLGFSFHPQVREASKAAIDLYGTTVSASRLIAGERPIHQTLEKKLANLHRTESALAFVSGHATNVTVIGQLLGKRDVVFTDAAIHNSVLEGARLSGAAVFQFAHNNLDDLASLLSNRSEFERALIVAEGLYSMDGDCCDLRRLIQLKQQHNCWLMIDEAHSVGVLGRTGLGISEELGVDPSNVDIWMGTLSKSLAATGGYIAASNDLIDILRTSAPGFVFSVGLAPSQTAAACASIDLMMQHPERVSRLQENALYFHELIHKAGLGTHGFVRSPIVPVVIGDPIRVVELSNRLLERGYNVPPVIFPAVKLDQARLRFFLSSEHKRDQLEGAVDTLASEISALRPRQTSIRE